MAPMVMKLARRLSRLNIADAQPSAQPSNDSIGDVGQGFIKSLSLRPAPPQRRTVDNISSIFKVWLNDYCELNVI